MAAKYFSKVEELALLKSEKTKEEKDLKYSYLKDAYLSLQLIYAGMKDEAKSNEYRKKKENAIVELKKKS